DSPLSLGPVAATSQQHCCRYRLHQPRILCDLTVQCSVHCLLPVPLSTLCRPALTLYLIELGSQGGHIPSAYILAHHPLTFPALLIVIASTVALFPCHSLCYAFLLAPLAYALFGYATMQPRHAEYLWLNCNP